MIASKSQNECTKEPFSLFLESSSSYLILGGARNRNDRTNSNCGLHGPVPRPELREKKKLGLNEVGVYI